MIKREREREKEREKDQGRRDIFPFVALLSISVLAAWPIARAGYPSIGDGLNHLYRLVEFDHLLRHGVWFPRWATDLGYGYGYPLFNFYPPLVYYLGAFFHFFGLSFPSSLFTIYLLALALAITGAYALAHEQWGGTGGLIAAGAYGLSPYLYFNILARGALPETWALGLLPWVLWAFSRLARRPGAGIFLLATLLYSALILSHLLSALLAAPLIFLFSFISFPKSPHTPGDSLPDLAVQTPGSITFHSFIVYPVFFNLRHSPLVIYPLVFISSLVITLLDHASPAVRRSSLALQRLYFSLGRAKRSLVTRHSSLPYLPSSFVFRPLSSVIFSFLLSSFFLLPALLETYSVQIQQLVTPGDLDFHNNFLNLGQLFAWPQTFDPRLVFIAVPPSLSLAALALALLGLTPRLWKLASQQCTSGLDPWDFAFFAVGAWELGLGIFLILLCLLTQPLTLLVWEKLPFANFIQFPWRLVGPASLLLALLAAAAAPILEDSWDKGPGSRLKAQGSSFVTQSTLSSSVLRLPSFVIFHFSFFILFLASLPWTFAPHFQTPAAPTIRDLAAYEAGGQLGTTSAGEFLPLDVHLLPEPNSLSAQYALTPIIERLAPLPEGVTLISQSATLTSATATVEARSSAAVTFNFFYFPGWQATVDGHPAPLQVSNPHGLIIVPIESGRHTFSLRFGSTPLRTASHLISLITLTALLALAALAFRSSLVTFPSSFVLRPSSFVTQSSHLSFALVPLLLLLTRLLFIDGHDTLFSRSRFNGATVSGVTQTLDVNFENQLVLIGLDLPHAALAADETLPVTLYWRAQNPPDADYAATLQVVDENGNLFGQADSRNPGLTPTSRWSLDQYARDVHRLTLLPGTPPGNYRLVAGVYHFGGPALNVLDENQIPQGQAFDLGALVVTRAKQPPTELNASQAFNLSVGPLTLLGQTLETPSPFAGDEVPLTLFWRAEAQARPDLKLRLELTALNGDVIHSIETDVARSDYPTSAWSLGEVVRAPLRFRIPASVPAGTATLKMSLISSGGASVAGPTEIATLNLRVPERSFVIPDISHPRSDMFGEVVKLLGYDIGSDRLVLYWQALAPMETSYTAFVHTLSADDQLLAQADSIPLKGSRPTTGWLPGEVLTDLYTLPLSGVTKIEVGLYDARSLERLGTVVITDISLTAPSPARATPPRTAARAIVVGNRGD